MKHTISLLCALCAALPLTAAEPLPLKASGEFDYGKVEFSGKVESANLLTENGLIFRNVPKGSSAKIGLKNFPAEKGTVSFWISPREWEISDAKFHIFLVMKFPSGSEKDENGMTIYRYANGDFNSTGLGICARYTGGNPKKVMVLNQPNNTVGQGWTKGSWHHVAVVYDNTPGSEKTALFIDDENVAQQKESLPVSAETVLILGPSWGDFSDTAMDRVIVDSSAWDREKISAEFEAGMTLAEKCK